MPDYLYLIHPFRHGFFDDPSGEEEAIMDEHLDYLKKAAEGGTVLLAGPCTDDTFGLVIFRAENEQAANAFMFADPCVQKNVMVAELHPLRISIQAK
ncbi:MAG: YciI family protein [Anaerolineales bacterium]